MNYDPTAANLLRLWVKRPWDDVVRLALADRCEELGLTLPLDLRGLPPGSAISWWVNHMKWLKQLRIARRSMCRRLKICKRAIEAVFGFIDPEELPF